MKRSLTAILFAASIASSAVADGFVSTDRFGYSGTVTRYATLADAQLQANAIDTISVGDRDLSLYIAHADTSVADINIIMGSWWYTMDEQYGPGLGGAGWGNTTGNTGVGYTQLYDDDASTDTSVSMAFGNFDGTYYTEYTLSIVGQNAGAADYSRFSAIDNVNDGGIWHEYALSFVAGGLEGQVVSPGVIESTNQPTSVSGTYTGLFEITENQTTPANQGFYVLDLTLSMTNWAFDNSSDLTSQISLDGGSTFFDGSFAASTFRAEVPEPTSLALLGLGGLAMLRRRRAN